MATKALKRWAKQRSPINSRIGFFNSSSLQVMMTSIADISIDGSIVQMLEAFFEKFKNYDFEQPIIIETFDFKQNLHQLGWSSLKPNPNESVTVLSLTYPFKNLAGSVKSLAVFTAMNKIHRASEIMKTIRHGSCNWNQLFEDTHSRKSTKCFCPSLVLNLFEHWEFAVFTIETSFRKMVDSIMKSVGYENIRMNVKPKIESGKVVWTYGFINGPAIDHGVLTKLKENVKSKCDAKLEFHELHFFL